MAGSVFFVTSLKAGQNGALNKRLKSLIPDDDDRYELAPDKWMVFFDGTARELAEKSGVRGGEEPIGTGLVLPVTTYSGRAPGDLWEWLRKKGA